MNDTEKRELTQMLRRLQAEIHRELGECIDEILERFVGPVLPPPPGDREEDEDASL